MNTTNHLWVAHFWKRTFRVVLKDRFVNACSQPFWSRQGHSKLAKYSRFPLFHPRQTRKGAQWSKYRNCPLKVPWHATLWMLIYSCGIVALSPPPPPCRGSQFLLNHGWDTPHYESRCGNTRDLREPDAVFSPNGSLMEACVIVLSVMRHNTNSRTVIQITKNNCGSVCIHPHTHVALARS